MLLKCNELDKRYWLLIILRIFLVFVPQIGYIHPDEFFQTLEIFVGRTFEVEYNPPWEFNTTLPIRSVALSYFAIGMYYKFLNAINLLMQDYTVHIVNLYTLLVIPRFIMCILSFIVDFSLYKICTNNNEKCQSRMVLLASSYVMIIYGTRTFSNTFELILFALLLYYVSESLIVSNILTRQREFLDHRYMRSRTSVERAIFHKYKLFISSDLLRNCLEISTIVVIGFFNRPTFLAFAVFPVFFWLYRGMGSKLMAKLKFHVRLLIFAIYCIPTTVIIVLIDSLFYGHLTWGEVGVLDVSINNFVFTPLNFLKYNMDSRNLAKHGLHPRFLHILVNMPLLFNVLALSGVYTLLQQVISMIDGKFHLLPSMKSIKGMMTLSVIAPVSILSIFPHQEPRFLIPVVIPLVYLYNKRILPEQETILIKAEQLVKQKSNKGQRKQPNLLLKMWFITNALLVVFYGFVHQAGIYSVISHLSKQFSTNPPPSENHIITSHIYSLPESFLLHRSTSKLYNTNGVKHTVGKTVFLYEEGSKSLDLVVKKIEQISDQIGAKRLTRPKRRFSIYFIIPSTLKYELEQQNNNLLFVEVKTFYLHLSVEALPNLDDYNWDLYSFSHYEGYNNSQNTLSTFKYLLRLFRNFGLILYKIQF